MKFYLRYGPISHMLYCRRDRHSPVNADDTLRFTAGEVADALPAILSFLDRKRETGDPEPTNLLAKLGIAQMVFEESGEPPANAVEKARRMYAVFGAAHPAEPGDLHAINARLKLETTP